VEPERGDGKGGRGVSLSTWNGMGGRYATTPRTLRCLVLEWPLFIRGRAACRGGPRTEDGWPAGGL
jgi:hypothetical protein